MGMVGIAVLSGFGGSDLHKPFSLTWSLLVGGGKAEEIRQDDTKVRPAVMVDSMGEQIHDVLRLHPVPLKYDLLIDSSRDCRFEEFGEEGANCDDHGGYLHPRPLLPALAEAPAGCGRLDVEVAKDPMHLLVVLRSRRRS